VSVLNSLIPVLIIATGAAIFRDRIGALQLTGIAISSLGVLTIIAHGQIETLRHLAFNKGDLITLANMFVFAIYATFLRQRPQIHWLSFLYALAVMSAAMTMPFFVWETLAGITFKPTLMTAFAIVYVSIFPSVLAFAAWNHGVELIGANRSGPFLHLVPIYTALLASTLLDEALVPHHVAGFALIFAGVALASRKYN
jgi:drug/metabolite transporter (DMT)-like permease